MNIQEFLHDMVEQEATDIFIVSGRPLSFKRYKSIVKLNDTKLLPDMTERLILDIYEFAKRDTSSLYEKGDDDFSFSLPGISRFRMNAYRQRGSLAAVIRVVSVVLPDATELGIPKGILELAEKQRGLVLITGPASSGKTTTLTCVLNQINDTRSAHIITLEDPIEYLHTHKKSIISQREIAIDTGNYAIALRAALRQSPDVILIGELRDMDAISIALTAAETGHYIFSTLHTVGAANAIDRLVDTYPSGQQEQIRMQLSMALQTVISQQLIPSLDGGVVPVFEIMHCNNAIKTLIRDGRTHQISSIIQSSSEEGMVSMDASLLKLYKEGIISQESAYNFSLSPQFLQKQIEKENK